MNKCQDCNKKLRESDTYLIKAKYDSEPYTELCDQCHKIEYKWYLSNNIRCVIITPRRDQ